MKTQIGKLKIEFEYLKTSNVFGRFGGGWNWVLGIQVGSSTVIFNLLIFRIRIDYVKYK